VPTERHLFAGSFERGDSQKRAVGDGPRSRRHRVFYRDAGESRDFLRTSDPAEAERLFVQKTRRLVEARYRGRRFSDVEGA
jgi:hypothetical protein